MKIVIITANEERHKFFRKYINNNKNIDVELAICENNKKRQSFSILKSNKSSKLQKKHFLDRTRYEKKFFNKYIKSFKKPINTIYVERGAINKDSSIIKKILKINPKYIISYGCGIIENKVISKFKDKFLNIHLGLSPYYRGSGSNYWPLVNNEPECVGATFMKIDGGIDTGPILHQIRANIKIKDNIHMIGNRLIFDMSKEIIKILNSENKFNFKTIKKKFYFYVKNNFNDESIIKIKNNFKNNMIKNYLKNKKKRDKKFKIIEFKY